MLAAVVSDVPAPAVFFVSALLQGQVYAALWLLGLQEKVGK